jgi:hypothetical protein
MGMPHPPAKMVFGKALGGVGVRHFVMQMDVDTGV